jgi:hypothetical protein
VLLLFDGHPAAANAAGPNPPEDTPPDRQIAASSQDGKIQRDKTATGVRQGTFVDSKQPNFECQ